MMASRGTNSMAMPSCAPLVENYTLAESMALTGFDPMRFAVVRLTLMYISIR